MLILLLLRQSVIILQAKTWRKMDKILSGQNKRWAHWNSDGDAVEEVLYHKEVCTKVLLISLVFIKINFCICTSYEANMVIQNLQKRLNFSHNCTIIEAKYPIELLNANIIFFIWVSQNLKPTSAQNWSKCFDKNQLLIN